jgi:hypothetical protein
LGRRSEGREAAEQKKNFPTAPPLRHILADERQDPFPFAPVPSPSRRDGWTPERLRIFGLLHHHRKGHRPVEEPYFFGWLQHGTRHVYDNRLLIAAYRAARRSKTLGPTGVNPALNVRAPSSSPWCDPCVTFAR